ncbi:unnamed protein product [Ceutorhynchus assimilis]|uniref:non-specific serine/threonine protein kinase n=1 Tax=Ceutorhynchus assimilis TaxID=467358 RepID=A0A9N9MQZ2_9CUCU|nr:unnamed protein product [Ceutorhynchus assimilis]
MQLYNNVDPKDTYDSLLGYVRETSDDETLSAKRFLQESEGQFGELPLITSAKQDYIYEAIKPFFNTKLLLAECQAQPTYFQQCYPQSLIQNCQKIGEGLYGEVFLFKNPSGGTTVMKIIPIEGDQRINGENQKKLNEVLSELIIATELSHLRTNPINQTSAFIEVQSIKCVQGCYPEELLDLWDLFKETRGSINDSPEIFKEDQLYAVLETSYGGCDMESFAFENASQAFSMCLQIAYAMAVAEEELQFEHRDLHWGNILLTRVPSDDFVTFKLQGREIRIESFGVKVQIIDFTMSRITSHGVDIYTDLSKDCGIFTGSGDYQFEIYQLMQKRNRNEWSHYEPYSNILWLSYILDKTITALHYKNSCCKQHKKYMNKLKCLNLEILGYDTTKEFVLNLVNNKFL